MKQLYCIFILSMLSIVGLQAQDLYIKFNSGTTVNYGLTTVDRITFSSSDMEVHLSGGSMLSYGLDSISYYNYHSILLDVNSVVTSAKEIKIYPNPSTGLIQLEYNLEEGGKEEIYIYNISGQEVFAQSKNQGAGLQKETLNLKELGLDSGVYFIELRFSNQRFINKLILN